jgi:hypothetical protein
MPEYKKILSGYVNKREDGREYLAITNTSDEDVVLKPGEKLYLNRTPREILEKNPKIPHFSKSVKVEERQNKQAAVDPDDFPF